MLKEKVVVKSEIGLNARVASMFLRNSVKFGSDIILIKDNNRYNGQRILYNLMEIKLFFEKSLLRDFFRINILTINLVSKLKPNKNDK